MNGKRKPGQSRKVPQRIVHRKEISNAVLMSRYLPDVAEELGIALSTLYRDIDKLKQEWLEESKEATGRVVAEELKKLQLIEDEAWLAWKRSIGKKEKTKASQTPQGTYASKEIEDINGDPRYLLTIHTCMKQRAELLALTDNKYQEGENAEEKARQVRQFLDSIIADGGPSRENDDNGK